MFITCTGWNNQTIPFCSRCVPGGTARGRRIYLRTVPRVEHTNQSPLPIGGARLPVVLVAATGIGVGLLFLLLGLLFLLCLLCLGLLLGLLGVGFGIALLAVGDLAPVSIGDGVVFSSGCQTGIAPGLGADAVLASRRRLALSTLAGVLVLTGWRAGRLAA